MTQFYLPNYYEQFHCIAGSCRHSCCIGWEIDVDEEAAERFKSDPFIAKNIDWNDPPQIHLCDHERCPFLREDGLCQMICDHGENILCQICRDHPRFRNYWTGREETGLGLVCEEAARIILSSSRPMVLVPFDPSQKETPLPEDEAWLWEKREELWREIKEEGPLARLREYLIFRHIPNALYDGRLEARMHFIDASVEEIKNKWSNTEGDINHLIEVARAWSYDVEYDEKELEKRLQEFDKNY